MLTTARWIAEVKGENTISFEHRIFIEIHQLKTWILSNPCHPRLTVDCTSMSTTWQTNTHTNTNIHTHTQNDYCNPCACTPRVNNMNVQGKTSGEHSCHPTSQIQNLAQAFHIAYHSEGWRQGSPQTDSWSATDGTPCWCSQE